MDFDKNYLIRLGALNINNKYVLPNDASKNEKYKCPDCPENVFLKAGSIKKNHFSHYPNSNCNFYKKNNNNSTIHNHCQYLLKKIFESSFKFIIKSCCVSCGFKKNKEILTKDCQLHIEYEYIYKDSKKKIDCAIVKDNEPIEFIEVYNTHRTKDQDRPFFIEISTENILEYDINEKFEEYYFNDIKYFECEGCINEKKLRIEEWNKIIEENRRLLKEKKEKEERLIKEIQRKERINSFNIKRMFREEKIKNKIDYIEYFIDSFIQLKYNRHGLNNGMDKWIGYETEVKLEVVKCYIEYPKGIQPITNFFKLNSLKN